MGNPASVPTPFNPDNVTPIRSPGTPQERAAATLELPSKGKFYGTTCPTGVIEIYPMTGRDEALTGGMDPNDISEIFDILLTRCLKTPLDVDNMLSTDKFFIMLNLRANSYGSFYEFRVRCPNCSLFQTRNCEVPTDFEVMEYKGDGNEPFETTLPVSKTKVEFRLLRGKDDKAVIQWRNKELEKGAIQFGDPSYCYRMAKHVVTIDGKTPENIGAAVKWFEGLIAQDASEFSNAIDEQVSGVNTELDITCSKCKTHFKTDMPFTASFFRTQHKRPSKSS